MNDQLESLGRLRLQAILLLAVVFVIGALAGAAFERARRFPPGPPAPHRHMPESGLRERLSLTPDQDKRINQILTGSRRRTEGILNAYMPQLRAVADSVRAEVRSLLTPEQQRIFDDMEPTLLPPPNAGHPPPEGPPRPPGPDNPMPPG